MFRKRTSILKNIFYFFKKLSKSWAFQTLENFLVEIQDSMSSELLRCVFIESEKKRKGELGSLLMFDFFSLQVWIVVLSRGFSILAERWKNRLLQFCESALLVVYTF